jgi:hypothetical protein
MHRQKIVSSPTRFLRRSSLVFLLFAIVLQVVPLGSFLPPAHAAVDPNDLSIERTYEHAPELQGNKNVYLDWMIWKDASYWLQNEITQVQCATTLGICQEKGWYSRNANQKNGTVGIYLLEENLPMTVTLSVTTALISDPTNTATVTINHFYRSANPDFTVSNFNEIPSGTQGTISINAPIEVAGYPYKTWFSCFLPSGVPCVVNQGFNAGTYSWEGSISLYNYLPGKTLEVQINRHWARVTGGVTDGTVGTTVKKFLVQTLKEGTQPKIANLKSEIGGCSFDITNYDPNFTYFFKRNSSEVQVSASGRVRLSGQAEGEIRDDYPSSSRAGYRTVNALGQLFSCSAQALPMAPINKPTVTISENSIMCKIGDFSKPPTSVAFSLMVDGKHHWTTFSAIGEYLPYWIVNGATPESISRNGNLESAQWSFNESFRGKNLACATLAYSRYATGMVESLIVRSK